MHDLAFGDQIRPLDLPGLGTVGGLCERPEGGHEAWFGYTDYTTPGVVLRYDAAADALADWQRAPGAVDLPAITAEQVAYASADGTTIRMVVISPAGRQLPGGSRGGVSSPFPAWRARPSCTGTAASTSA